MCLQLYFVLYSSSIYFVCLNFGYAGIFLTMEVESFFFLFLGSLTSRNLECLHKYDCISFFTTPNIGRFVHTHLTF